MDVFGVIGVTSLSPSFGYGYGHQAVWAPGGFRKGHQHPVRHEINKLNIHDGVVATGGEGAWAEPAGSPAHVALPKVCSKKGSSSQFEGTHSRRAGSAGAAFHEEITPQLTRQAESHVQARGPAAASRLCPGCATMLLNMGTSSFHASLRIIGPM